MKKSAYGIVCLIVLAPVTGAAPDSGEQNWTHYARIGAYGLHPGNAPQIVRSAQEDGVFGIEVDNHIAGRYESFVAPEEKLKAIREVAGKAHAAGNRAFVYIAGTECITANADKTPQTGVQVTIQSATKGRGFFRPFLGEVQSIEGAASTRGMTYALPAIEKEAVFWYEP